MRNFSFLAWAGICGALAAYGNGTGKSSAPGSGSSGNPPAQQESGGGQAGRTGSLDKTTILEEARKYLL